jgi:hypothetical protein
MSDDHHPLQFTERKTIVNSMIAVSFPFQLAFPVLGSSKTKYVHTIKIKGLFHMLSPNFAKSLAAELCI